MYDFICKHKKCLQFLLVLKNWKEGKILNEVIYESIRRVA